MNARVRGFLYGVATSVTFGLIPLFTLPLMRVGLASDSILFLPLPCGHGCAGVDDVHEEGKL